MLEPMVELRLEQIVEPIAEPMAEPILGWVVELTDGEASSELPAKRLDRRFMAS